MNDLASPPVMVLTTDELGKLAAPSRPAPNVYAVRSRWRTPAGNYHYPVTQAAFAKLLGVPVTTVREWEQGRRVPDAAARRLLALFDAAPDEMRAALGKLASSPPFNTALPWRC